MSTSSAYVVFSFLILVVLMIIGKVINAVEKWPKVNGARIAFWCLLVAMIGVPLGLFGYFELFQPSDDLDLAFARGELAGEISFGMLPAWIVAGILSFLFSSRHGKKRVRPATRQTPGVGRRAS